MIKNTMAKEIFDCEIESLIVMKDALNEAFDFFVEEITTCKGRIIWTGMGKSGNVCQKIVATMQSLGIKSFFLHPSEALHGGLGAIDTEDLVIALSNSGETDEVLNILNSVKKIGATLLSIVGRQNSTLQKFSKYTIIIPPIKEAFLNSLVPTSSTTVSMVLGDALAIVSAEKRGFTQNDFGNFHPNGTLGKKLTLKVKDIMVKNSENAIVMEGVSVKTALFEMCKKSISGVNIVSEDGKLQGILTDGDMRRLFNQNNDHMLDICVDEIMTKRPITFSSDDLVYDVIKKINDLGQGYSFFPVEDEGYLMGALRMIDLTKSGLLG